MAYTIDMMKKTESEQGKVSNRPRVMVFDNGIITINKCFRTNRDALNFATDLAMECTRSTLNSERKVLRVMLKEFHHFHHPQRIAVCADIAAGDDGDQVNTVELVQFNTMREIRLKVARKHVEDR